MHVSLLPVESVQQCMQCCKLTHLEPNRALCRRICCTLGTDSSDTMIVSLQAVRAGDVRTFQQEMYSNMHTFCVQVHNLCTAHLTPSSRSLSAETHCISKPMFAVDIPQTQGLLSGFATYPPCVVFQPQYNICGHHLCDSYCHQQHCHHCQPFQVHMFV